MPKEKILHKDKTFEKKTITATEEIFL